MPTTGPMKEDDVESLRQNYVDIIENLEPTQVIDNLYQNHAISSDEFESIQNCKTRRDKNRKLMYILRHRPEDKKAFDLFKEALNESHDFIKEQIEHSETFLKPLPPIMESRAIAMESFVHPSKKDDQRVYSEGIFDSSEKNRFSFVSPVESNSNNFSSSKKDKEKLNFNCAHGHMSKDVNMNATEKSWEMKKDIDLSYDETDLGPSQSFSSSPHDENSYSGESEKNGVNQLSHVNPIANKLFLDGNTLYAKIPRNNLRKSLLLRDEAIRCLLKSAKLLSKETSYNGKLDYIYASLKLALVRLGCGEYMQCIELQPTEDDILDSEVRLQEIDSSKIKLPETLLALYFAVKCDLHLRRHNIPRAIDYAEISLQNCIKQNWYQQSKMAECRLEYLKKVLDESESATNVLVRQFDSDEMEDTEILDFDRAKVKPKKKHLRERNKADKLSEVESSDSDTDCSLKTRKNSRHSSDHSRHFSSLKQRKSKENYNLGFINFNESGEIEIILSFSTFLNIILIIAVVTLTILYTRASP